MPDEEKTKKTKDKRQKITLSGRVKLLAALLALAVFVGFFWRRGRCYEHKIDEGFTEKTRIEIIVDYFNGKEYEAIEWLSY